MIFTNISILDENMQIQENMYVGIKNDKVDYIGKEMPISDYGEVYRNGKGKLLMSGFYNTHAHSPMTLLRGYGENLALQDWLNQRIFPFEAKLDGNAVYWGTLLAMAESLRFGIVSTTDMYYFCEDMARAIEQSGAKNNIGRGVTNFSDGDLYDLESFAEMKALYGNYHNAAGGKIKVDMSLHAEYTSNPKTVQQMAAYTKSIGANMHVHVSETKLEHEECKARHGGLTPIQYLNSLGLLDNKTTAAHCVWIEPEDMDIIKEKGVTVASNPISNLKLASGVCNVPELLRRGINVSIGTDSVASNNSLNFLEEMKVFAISAKEKYQDPTAVTPVQTLHAATRAGALSQGREDCGLLAVGCKADLIMLDIMRPNFAPIHDMANNLVYSACGGDIVMTMVDGKVLYQDGQYKTIDIEKTIFETNKAAAKILSQL
ncbi:amidohydrolase [Aminipila butyrica]|uniref:Amidohydrolase n=1 Tax=Aminipila butyrica TaxID=433296 RepID=A0A858BUA6_9FIRM|nr:amidohydrolase [Aminipila butyrica]QIB69621.1 amidohydrolase [Aminipila butyrica]